MLDHKDHGRAYDFHFNHHIDVINLLVLSRGSEIGRLHVSQILHKPYSTSFSFLFFKSQSVANLHPHRLVPRGIIYLPPTYLLVNPITLSIDYNKANVGITMTIGDDTIGSTV